MAPSLPPDGDCQVWWAPTVAADDNPTLLDLLDADERQRHRDLRDSADRGRYLVAHALLRLVVGAMLRVDGRTLAFRATCRQCGGPHGKPELSWPAAPLRLSISHSGDWCVVAVARAVEVGVDVEQIALRGSELPVRALSSTERAIVDDIAPTDRTAAFIRYWTRKEALLKATGDGLAVDPARITLSAPDRPAAMIRWDAAGAPVAEPHLADLTAPPGYAAALASLGRRLRISESDGAELLRAGRTRAADTTHGAST